MELQGQRIGTVLELKLLPSCAPESWANFQFPAADCENVIFDPGLHHIVYFYIGGHCQLCFSLNVLSFIARMIKHVKLLTVGLLLFVYLPAYCLWPLLCCCHLGQSNVMLRTSLCLFHIHIYIFFLINT